jgi:AcrR family transcriptional regulator
MESSALSSAKAAAATPPVKRARGPKHEDKRIAILRTAAQLFAMHGYEATSLDQVAEQLGMHKATLYHYIRSKEEILYQCLVMSFENLEPLIDRMHDRDTPALERLRQFAIHFAHAQNNDFGRCLVLVGPRPLEIAARSDIQIFLRRLDTTVRDLVTEGIASGDIKPCHPGMLSAMLFGMLSWVPQWFKPQGRLSLDEIVDSFMETLTLGVATRP